MSIREFPPNATCEEFLAFGGQPTPDSDISGLGVILAFTVSAYLTFFLVLISYFFGQVDASLLNTVDTHVFHVRPKRARAPGEATSKTSNLRLGIALRQAILALSDQQIVTGIAIMAAGFQGLRLGGIDSYHYQTVLYLAWMSSSVHLSALSILSPVLRIRPALKVWRLVGMLVLLILLIIGLVPTVSNDWGLLSWDGMRPNQSGWGIPAICFWGETWGDGVNPDAVLGFLLLIISYGWKVGGVFPSACSAYRRWIVYPIEWLFECLLSFTAKGYSHAQVQRKPMQVFWLVAYRVVLAVWVPYFALFETLASFSSAVWISALGLIFGTLQIAIPRQQNQPLLGSNEDTWGFGQLVPLILLIQPLSAVWEVLIIDDESIREERLDVGSSKNQDLARSASKTSSPCNERRQSDVQYPLLQHFACYTPIQLAKCDPAKPTTAELTLLGSRIFYLNVYLTQPAIIIASVLAYLTDADSIGYETSGNWLFTSWILAACIGVAWLLTFCLSPWSVIGRLPKEGQSSGDIDCELTDYVVSPRVNPSNYDTRTAWPAED